MNTVQQLTKTIRTLLSHTNATPMDCEALAIRLAEKPFTITDTERVLIRTIELAAEHTVNSEDCVYGCPLNSCAVKLSDPGAAENCKRRIMDHWRDQAAKEVAQELNKPGDKRNK